jgi:hypothetical protein
VALVALVAVRVVVRVVVEWQHVGQIQTLLVEKQVALVVVRVVVRVVVE